MLQVGIVAEYNPFHNGHEYQIHYARNVLKADQIVVIMSGNFTQRGIPAICDKRYRADAAIYAGADVVLEMPPVVAIADTPMFAQGAVDILHAYGCNSILFGSENDNLELLKQLADIMVTDEYWERFDSYKELDGLSPDDARIKACKELSNRKLDDYAFVNQPNNLLGIYYISAIIRRRLSLSAFTNKRMGQGYFDDKITQKHRYASATAIRRMIMDHADSLNCEELEKFMPSKMAEGIMNSFKANELVFPEQFHPLYVEAMMNTNERQWKKLCPMVPRERIQNFLGSNDSFDKIKSVFMEYMSELKASRMINWIFLGMDQKTIKEFIDSDHIGWYVLASRAFEQILKTYECSENLKSEWERIDQIYEKGKKQVIKWNY